MYVILHAILFTRDIVIAHGSYQNCVKHDEALIIFVFCLLHTPGRADAGTSIFIAEDRIYISRGNLDFQDLLALNPRQIRSSTIFIVQCNPLPSPYHFVKIIKQKNSTFYKLPLKIYLSLIKDRFIS